MRNLGLIAALLAIGSLGWGCKEDFVCLPELDDPPMSLERAKALEPDLETGLALSTTLISGDCRPSSRGYESRDRCGRPIEEICKHDRTDLRVQVVAAGVSVPVGEGCGNGAPVDEVALRSDADDYANLEGEWVARLTPGVYLVYLSEDDTCAYCGLNETQASCQVEIELDAITVRDLDLDRATR